MDFSQRFCVRWNSYKSNLQTAFPKLLTSEHFVDVTLACEKQFLKCHKVVLSACSFYFEDLLVNNPCPHPIIFMKDIAFWEMKALVEFMYKGEVSVSQEQLNSLLKSAESLQIRGLSGAKKWMDEPEVEPKKRKKTSEDEDSKPLQITTCDDKEEIKSEDAEVNSTPSEYNDKLMEFKEEILEVEDSYLDQTDEDEAQTYSDEAYQESSREAGPSGIAEFISLEDLENGHIGGQTSQPESADGKKSANKMKMTLSRRGRCGTIYKQYTADSMWSALKRIQQGLSVYRASLEYGVPRKTLRNWMKKYNIMSHFDLRKQDRIKNDDTD